MKTNRTTAGLARRIPLLLATLLAVAVSLDTLLTWAQAVLWNVPRVRGVGDALTIVVACVGPALGAVVLWAAHRGAAVGRRPGPVRRARGAAAAR